MKLLYTYDYLNRIMTYVGIMGGHAGALECTSRNGNHGSRQSESPHSWNNCS